MTTNTGESFSRDLELNDLLDGISSGRVGLPNFQRDFDWNEPDVVSLLATVLCGWPAGSLLLMAGSPSFFKIREFQDAPDLRRSSIEYVVLDGQQRLTSLFHAFRGAGKKVYAISVERALSGAPTAELIEDALVVLREDDLQSPTWQREISNGSLVPLYAVTSPADFFEWRDNLVSSLPSDQQRDVSQRLAALYRDILSNAHRYRFPAMLLTRGLAPEAIARIFERINKTGMRLSTFDLLVARSYTEDWNLRDVWEEARDERPHLEDFVGEDGLAIAQTIALRSSSRDVRQPAVLKLPAEVVQREWDLHVSGMQRACEFLTKHGCLDAKWLPYRSQLLPLAGLAMEFDLDEHRDTLLGWFWGSGLANSYDVASSTVAADDFSRLRNAMLGNGTPPTYEVSRAKLANATRQNSGSTWRTVRSLLLSNGAHDLISGRALAGQDSDSLAMVPVVPKAQGKDTASPHLLVLAQVLAEKSSVRQLRAKPFGLRSDVDFDRQGLKSQFLPHQEVESFLWDPRSLVETRIDALIARLTATYPGVVHLV